MPKLLKVPELRNKKFLLEALSFLTLLYEAGVLIFANLTQIQYHLGFDASSAYLHAIEIWRQKSLIPSTFVLTTTLGWDSPDPLAALFYGMTGNIFLSFGIANLLLLAVLAFCFVLLLKELGLTRPMILLALNFLLCPLIMVDHINNNNLSYFAMLLCEQGSYSIKIMIMLLLLLVVARIEHGKKCFWPLLAASALNLISSISSGSYAVITVLIPCLLYYLIKLIYQNSLRSLRVRGILFVFLELLLSAVGKRASASLFGFSSKENSMMLTGILDFRRNLDAVIIGYPHLVGAITTESNISVTSPAGIAKLASIALMLLTILIAFILLIRLYRQFRRKEGDLIVLLPYTVILVNLFLFVTVYTLYDDYFFESRYMIILYLMLVCIVCLALQRIADSQLLKPVLILCILAALLVQTTGLFHTYYAMPISDYDEEQTLLSEVDRLGTPIAYVWGDSFFITGRNFRAMDTNVVYKILNVSDEPNSIDHWGDYTYYDETSSWTGATALITTADEYDTLPSYLQQSYTLVDSIGEYQLYESQSNPFDLTVYDKNSTINCNYPYTDGVETDLGSLQEDGSFVTDGEAGQVLNMPVTNVTAGSYEVSIACSVLSENDSSVQTADSLPVACLYDQNGQKVAETILSGQQTGLSVGTVTIVSDGATASKALIPNLYGMNLGHSTQDQQFTLSITEPEGCILKIQSITFTRQ